ncbi:MAG: hypothetical protein CHACPFDD_01491 [Phycisphaerae bacterium]|nr:hypothetical protein [Phycisphaerae bacterium]
MFRHILLAVSVVALAAPSFADRPLAGGARFQQRPGELEFSGRLIVRPLPSLDAPRAAVARQRLDGMVIAEFPEVGELVIQLPTDVAAAPGSAENGWAARLLATGDYQYVHPDWICYPTATPNDPDYPSQWHHPVIQSPQAWDLETGSNAVICAFTDTGVDLTHPDLTANRVPGYNAYTDTAEVDGGDVSDIHGHGTHVSGCAAAIGNNGTGVAGVGWDLKNMMIRVAIDSSGGAYLTDILEGARWAIEHGAAVVSSSYSGVENDSIGTTGTYIKSIGGLYCYAAGNSLTDLSWFDYPDVIVVGASSYGDAAAWFSSYGHAVDVFAPGVDILSSCVGGGYCYASGTSMATPVTNGVIGMIWSANSNLSAQAVENILFASCDDLGDAGNDEFWGWGRVNVYKAVQAAIAAGDIVGDMNCDGAVDGFDVDPFVLAMINPVEYANQYPACDITHGDVNGDGSINGFDVDGFVDLLDGP